jgi:hypothetical protein
MLTFSRKENVICILIFSTIYAKIAPTPANRNKKTTKTTKNMHALKIDMKIPLSNILL